MLKVPAAATTSATENGSVMKNRRMVHQAAEHDGATEHDGAAESGSVVIQQRFELNEDPSFWKDNSVQVVIRVRPLNSTEIATQGHHMCVRQESCESITWTGPPESRFTFDLVADEHVSQEQLFKVAGVPMVENCVAGYNSCMFAYGQTGSGKTYTMLGDIEGGTRRHSVNAGMTPRVFEYLFSRIQKEKETRRDEKLQFTCKCSFLEIYNEHILDLLDPSSVNLQIREDARKGIYVENLMEFEVTSARGVMQQLIQGAANRKVAATNMNRASSRSHSVFTCVIESKWESQGITHRRFARLNLVDLAGSERQKSSGAEGDRLKEATNINKSLSTLGLVIMNLVSISSKKTSSHVPYRDSKLTFLLQDSLGGNSKTTIIANISPSNCCALETLSTLKFAQRAKYIRNNAVINEDASGNVLAMRLQNQQLQKEVSRLRALLNAGANDQYGDSVSTTLVASPENFKLDGHQGSFSPLTFDKRLSQIKEYEVALVAAFRRDQEKGAALKALIAEKQVIEQLVAQRTEEVKNLKMRLRFREDGVRRLEEVASGKLTAEAHLLQEKGELLKEIEVLRNQVDRNPEVTRFAMENLRLKEDLRRLESFVDEGERDMLNQQIVILQDKLLEALDWKLMHEKDEDISKDLSFKLESVMNEENEFLRLQAIQNQKEIDTLRRNLNFCLESKEKLERRVEELLLEQDEHKKHITYHPDESAQPQISTVGSRMDEASSNEQTELTTMVDAIAAASQREAEAHETAIILAKENENLRAQLQILSQDNEKLIEMYEGAIAKNKFGIGDESLKETRVDDLGRQLEEMQEENEKLMGLYEKAMQEKDDIMRKLSSAEDELSCQPKLVEVDMSRDFLSVNDIEVLDTVRKRLEVAQDKLMILRTCTGQFGLLEKATININELSETFEVMDRQLLVKQQNVASLKLDLSEIQEKKARIDNKLLALKSALQNFSSNGSYWEEREGHARTRVNVYAVPLKRKLDELACLQTQKQEFDASNFKATQKEAELKDNLDKFKLKLEDSDARRKETEKVLFAIQNIQSAPRAANFGKASELLKSEEERTKIVAEIEQLKKKLASTQKRVIESRKHSEALNLKIQNLEADINCLKLSFEEAEAVLENIIKEKEILLDMKEQGKKELDAGIVDYQECIFLLDLKEGEIKIFEETLKQEARLMEDLKCKRDSAFQILSHLLSDSRNNATDFISSKVEQELHEIETCLAECKPLLAAYRNS